VTAMPSFFDAAGIGAGRHAISSGAAKRHPDEKPNPQVRGADLGDPGPAPEHRSRSHPGSPVCGVRVAGRDRAEGLAPAPRLRSRSGFVRRSAVRHFAAPSS
jgi:hypothetical protein